MHECLLLSMKENDITQLLQKIENKIYLIPKYLLKNTVVMHSDL